MCTRALVVVAALVSSGGAGISGSAFSPATAGAGAATGTVAGAAVAAIGAQAAGAQAASTQTAGSSAADAQRRELQTALEAGRYADAEQLGLKLIATLESDPARALDLAEAIDLVLDARRGARRLSASNSVDLAERALRIQEAALGHDAPRVARTLMLLGLTRASARKYDAAREAAERAVAIQERLVGQHHLDYVAALNALAWVQRLETTVPLAITTAQRALDLARALETPPGDETSTALKTLGSLAFLQSEYELVVRYYGEALTIDERVHGSQHPIHIQTLSQLSGAVRNTGDAERAMSLQDRVVRQLEQTPGMESRLGFEMVELATMFDAAGDYPAALSLCERALAVAERATGPNSALTAAVLGFTAAMHDRLGDHAAASAIRQRTITLWMATLGPESVHVATTLSALSESLYEAGQIDEAFAAIDRALAIKSLQKEPTDYARVLQAQARLLSARGRLTESREVLDHAREVAATGAASQTRIELAMALTELARLDRQEGHPATALPRYREAIRLLSQELGPTNVRTASRQLELAAALAEAGQWDEARQELRSGAPVSLDHLRLIARTLSDRRALEFAAERQTGIDLAMTLAVDARAHRPGDLEHAWTMVIHSRTVVLDEMAARQRTVVAEAGNAAVKERWDTLTHARTRLANLIVRGAEGSTPEQYQSAVDRARASRDLAERELAAVSLAFEQEQRRGRASLQDVLEKLPRDGALVAFVRYTPQRLSPAIAPKQVRIESGVERAPSTGTAPAAAESRKPSSSGEGGRTPDAEDGRRAAYAAFVGRPDGTSRLVPLGSAERVEAAITAWRARIQAELTSGGIASRRTEAAYREAGTVLRTLLWDPVRAHVGTAGSVFVIPDGAIHLVDLSTLPTGKTAYLVDAPFTLHYLLAEHDLVQPPSEPHGTSLLALGAPDFDNANHAATTIEGAAAMLAANNAALPVLEPLRRTRSACDAFATRTFAPLPATRQEVQHVAELWLQGTHDDGEARTIRRVFRSLPDASGSSASATHRSDGDGASSAGADTPGPGPGDVERVIMLGDDAATEAAFKVLAPGRRVLHLATHGFFLDRSCIDEASTSNAPAAPASASSAAADTTSRSTPGVFGSRQVLEENPLLRSGLVMAGANHRVPNGQDDEDGILTAEEIAGLDLSAAQWAVLSACDTGRGDWQAGEGVLGLRRAFQVAGARTVILSLWPVIDTVASNWMAELYRGRFVNSGTAPKVMASGDSLRRDSGGNSGVAGSSDRASGAVSKGSKPAAPAMSTAAAVRGASRALLAARRAAGESTHPLYWSGFIATGDWR